jgi:hypothetical protein
MTSIVQSLKSIFLSCKGIAEKVMTKALGGCSQALHLLSTVFGILLGIGIVLGCGILMIPIEALDYTSAKLSQPSEVQA